MVQLIDRHPGHGYLLDVDIIPWDTFEQSPRGCSDGIKNGEVYRVGLAASGLVSEFLEALQILWHVFLVDHNRVNIKSRYLKNMRPFLRDAGTKCCAKDWEHFCPSPLPYSSRKLFLALVMLKSPKRQLRQSPSSLAKIDNVVRELAISTLIRKRKGLDKTEAQVTPANHHSCLVSPPSLPTRWNLMWLVHALF